MCRRHQTAAYKMISLKLSLRRLEANHANVTRRRPGDVFHADY